MKAIINNLNIVIYKYEKGLYPSCLAERNHNLDASMGIVSDDEYKHIEIPDEIVSKHWLRIKWDPELKIFIEDTNSIK